MEKIINALEFYTGTFPRRALKEATENKDKIVPPFAYCFR